MVGIVIFIIDLCNRVESNRSKIIGGRKKNQTKQKMTPIEKMLT